MTNLWINEGSLATGAAWLDLYNLLIQPATDTISISCSASVKISPHINQNILLDKTHIACLSDITHSCFKTLATQRIVMLPHQQHLLLNKIAREIQRFRDNITIITLLCTLLSQLSESRLGLRGICRVTCSKKPHKLWVELLMMQCTNPIFNQPNGRIKDRK